MGPIVEYIRHIDILLYLVSALILYVFYLFYLLPLSKKSKSLKDPKVWPAVSVIIAYKNEHENLKYHLDHWLAQDYPEFEIILVDDHSDDESSEFLTFRKTERMKLLSLNEESGKKAAIQQGIAASTNSFLLFTDADCKPMSNQWIKEMIKPLINGKEISVGYSGFYPKANILNAIQRYENCMNSLQNAAMIKKGRAYMAVGRNLAYKKEILTRNEIDIVDNVLSGDDDLLVNSASANGNTVFIGKPSAQTISEAASDWKAYFFQRRRQLQAGLYYRISDRIKLAVLGLSQLLFILLFIKHLIYSEILSIILSIFVIKLVLQLSVSYKAMKRMGESDLWWQLPILEIIYLPLISLIGISQYLYKVDRWK
ncbi:MAG: hypothetical protein CMP59_07905 [Flavobacteriales bacterium]|nr:hypothetical protein [Flavobacteriales bacterium]|tara:strand:+ start:728 stop:1834 length:1107 start_codon:yes stop_codon:yes gene_type:complete